MDQLDRTAGSPDRSFSLTRVTKPGCHGAFDRRLLHKAFRALTMLYATILLIDPIRKSVGGSSALLGAIYIGVLLLYLSCGRIILVAAKRSSTLLLPLASLLAGFCLVLALIDNTPLPIALIGITSYVFFIPLFYIGFAISTSPELTRRLLAWLLAGSVIVAAGSIIGGLFQASAPAILQPITADVANHSSGLGNVFLAPSLLADGEQAAEQILVGCFVFVAIAFSRTPPRRKIVLPAAGVTLAGGLLLTGRRTELLLLIIGTTLLLLRATVRRRKARSGGIRILVISVMLGLVAFAALNSLGASRVLTFIRDTADAHNRATLLVSIPKTDVLVGQGPGTSAQLEAVKGVVYNNLDPMNPSYQYGGHVFYTVEGGLSETWKELGFVGTTIYGAIFVLALNRPLRRCLRADMAGRALAYLSLAFFVLFLKAHASLNDPLTQPLFWVITGLGAGAMEGREPHRLDPVRSSRSSNPPRVLLASRGQQMSASPPVGR